MIDIKPRAGDIVSWLDNLNQKGRGIVLRVSEYDSVEVAPQRIGGYDIDNAIWIDTALLIVKA